MSVSSNRPDLSPDKQALLALRKMRTRLDELERARTEPIAIVGLGCRLPGGVVDGESYWQLLIGGVDAVGDIPPDRFDSAAFYDPDPDAAGKIYTRRGAFVRNIDEFDADFFGISPREAVRLDPQQRLLLELAWEALEDAGQSPQGLHGSRTGVFVGVGSSDYGQLQMRSSNASPLDRYFGTGTVASATAGRLSYVLGLVGPSIAVDTACSASLVAVHLAVQSLRGGECRVALAGGINLNILPDIFVNLCQARMLSPDGRCKTFDAAANGYVRGEGGGIIVLKRLSDAVRDRDRIHALIRGTAVNQDGRSGGFTAPSETSQEELLREALHRAGVSAGDVGYVEAHGTGTPLGDPIEMHALASVLCAGRAADRPLFVGSVKTNIGHLEAAAGIAGLLKAILVLRHRTIPPHLHLETLNPHLALAGAPIVVPTTAQQWLANDARPRLAGVSSFGFTGTNAHAILEEPPAVGAKEPGQDRPAHVLALSARSDVALRDLAKRYEAHLAHPGVTLPDICFTANAGRSHFDRRLAVTGETIADVRGSLAAWLDGRQPREVLVGKEPAPSSPEVAFLFTGQGSQYARMGRRLYDTQPTFRAAMDRCDAVLRPQLERPLLSIIDPTATASLLDETRYTQPALFALEYALAEMWRSWGVEPAIVLGHSLGEYVAATVAGLLTVEDALELVAVRARLMQDLPHGGAMAAIFADEAQVRSALASEGDAASIAAVNGPSNVVISGLAEAIERVCATLRSAGVSSERLNVSHAFHSKLMEPMLDQFGKAAARVTFQQPRLAFVSNLTGGVIDPAAASTPDYWQRHLRETVRFSDGIRTLVEQRATVCLELGPGATLSALGRVIAGDRAAWLASLRKGRDDWRQIAETLGDLYTRHVDIDWTALDGDARSRKVALPTYPFQRRRYWVGDDAALRAAPVPIESSQPAAQAETARPRVEAARAAGPHSVPVPDVRTLLEMSRASRRRAVLHAFVSEQARVIFGWDPGAPFDLRRGLRELGMDSLMGIEFKNRLQRGVGCELPATLAFDHPTVDAITAYLADDVLSLPSAQEHVEPISAATRSSDVGPADDPIAVIGLGCRFPGSATDPEAFWHILERGEDVITDVPADRWDAEAFYDPDPDATGKTYAKRGGFLREIDRFDAQFFGITPREAASLDPQQRLLLEVSWEALEAAGQVPDRLHGSLTGVFVGIGSADYMRLQTMSVEPPDRYAGTGNAMSVAAGRLSYTLGLQGPCVAVDTACSSSLVAVHLACQSLRNRECGLAIAGGVNAILAPDATVMLSRGRMLSVDGRCKTFDASADGYVRSEGCGMVVLKRLSDAQAAGDPILAVVRGSAINQDGRTSGLTAPNGRAQEAVIRMALERAGVPGSDIDYVEAHGTGTPLGDPIEVQAVGAVLGDGRPAGRPVLIGSVKTNLGHLETAAGIAGFIKVVLALQKETLPAHLGLRRPNPYIPWSALPVRVVTEPLPWRRSERPRLAGISAFGFSGSNAHLILAEAPASVEHAATASRERPLQALAVSARTPAALDAIVARYEQCLLDPSIAVTDLCFSANTGRSHFEHRLVAVGANAEGLRAALASARSGRPLVSISRGRVDSSSTPVDIAFQLSGDQFADNGAARELYDAEPAFRAALDESAACVKEQWDIPLLDVLFATSTGAPPPPEIRDVLLFSFEYALAELWKSWGVRPAAVIGQDAGEYVAACLAGVIGLGDGLRLAIARGRVIAGLANSDEFDQVASTIVCAAPRIDLISGVTGVPVSEAPRADYWRHPDIARLPSARATAAVAAAGYKLVLEVGTGAASPGRQDDTPEQVLRIPALAPGGEVWTSTLTALAQLHVRGIPVDWSRFDRPDSRRRVALPTYPFQRERHWIDTVQMAVPPAVRTSEGPGSAEYELSWEAMPAATPPAVFGSKGRTYLIVGDSCGVADALASQLEELGASAVIIDAERTGDLAPYYDGRDVAGVVHLKPLDIRAVHPDSAAAGVIGLVRLAQAQARLAAPGRLWVATAGAQTTGADGGPSAIAQAPIWGFGRVLVLEHPELQPRLIDLPAGPAAEQAAALLDEIRRSDDENQVAIRGGVRHVVRLLRSAPGEDRRLHCSPDATYLITGGSGALGLQVAQRLADCGARHLLLTSRRGASGREDVFDTFERRGVEARVVCADAADHTAMRALVDGLRSGPHPLRGVVHAAGVSTVRRIVELGEPELEDTLRSKVSGGWILHSLTEDLPLDFFVTFSSIAAVWGSAGQAHYAAANHFLDALAHYRAARALPALSINWGPWSGDGMATEDARSALTMIGVRGLAPDAALDTLERLLAGGRTQVTVAAVDWDVFKPIYNAKVRRPLLDRLSSGTQRPEPKTTFANDGAIQLLRVADIGERRAIALRLVSDAVTAILRLPPATLDPALPLRTFGLDSLIALELRNRIERDTGAAPGLAQLLDGPSVTEITEIVLRELDAGDAVGDQLPTTNAASVLPEDVDELSDANVDALLKQMLAGR